MAHDDHMSSWAVHFTSASAGSFDAPGEESGYDNMTSILWHRRIEPVEEPHGGGREIAELSEVHRPACFSEIPLHLLGSLIEHRSDYGIGFSQEFLLASGGGRVLYLEQEGRPAAAAKRLIESKRAEPFDPEDPLWELTPFIEFPVTGSLDDWRWEREWRVPGGLAFDVADVAFLFIPEELHHKALQFFSDHKFAGTGPAYICPYIDPQWDRSRIEKALADVPVELPPSEAAVAERMSWSF
ncbi:MAG TPA: hypothetical protein VMS60_06170 [Solirubrobacterales bacterium]|nr:hypothetical protein [Solirubrobacterales bacterium]